MEFKRQINPETDEPEVLIPAVLVSVSETIKELTNKNGEKTQYQLGLAEMTYPNGKKATVGGSIWTNSIASNPASFVKGAPVLLTVQETGEYAGFSKIGLPELERVDIAMLGLKQQAQKEPLQNQG